MSMKCPDIRGRNVTDSVALADLRGALCVRPGPKCSQFHAVFRKIWQNHSLAPPPQPEGLVPPSYGNHESAYELILIGKLAA